MIAAGTITCIAGCTSGGLVAGDDGVIACSVVVEAGGGVGLPCGWVEHPEKVLVLVIVFSWFLAGGLWSVLSVIIPLGSGLSGEGLGSLGAASFFLFLHSGHLPSNVSLALWMAKAQVLVR